MRRSRHPGRARPEHVSFWGTCTAFTGPNWGGWVRARPPALVAAGSQVAGEPCPDRCESCRSSRPGGCTGRPGPGAQWALSLPVTSTSLVCPLFVCLLPRLFLFCFSSHGARPGAGASRGAGLPAFPEHRPSLPRLGPHNMGRQNSLTCADWPAGPACQGPGAVLGVGTHSPRQPHWQDTMGHLDRACHHLLQTLQGPALAARGGV